MQVALFLIALLAASSAPKPVITPTVPVTVNVPSSVTSPDQARPFFDAFSWQSFIASTGRPRIRTRSATCR